MKKSLLFSSLVLASLSSVGVANAEESSVESSSATSETSVTVTESSVASSSSLESSSSSTEMSSSSATTSEVTSRIEISETSQSTEKSSTKEKETDSSKTESSTKVDKDYETLYADTLSKVATEGNPRVDIQPSLYTFYDVDGDGTKELVTGVKYDNGQISLDSLYYLKDGVPTLVASTSIRYGVHGSFIILADGRVIQLTRVPQSNRETKAIYQFQADKNEWVLVEQEPFEWGSGRQNPAEGLTVLDESKLEWKTLGNSSQTTSQSAEETVASSVSESSTSQSSTEDTKQAALDVNALMANDFSSVAGQWSTQAKNKKITITSEGHLYNVTDSMIKSLRYVKTDENGVLWFTPAEFYGKATDAIYKFAPAGVTYGRTDSTSNRFILANGMIFLLDNATVGSQATPSTMKESTSGVLSNHDCLPSEAAAAGHKYQPLKAKVETGTSPSKATEASKETTKASVNKEADKDLPASGDKTGIVTSLLGAGLLAVVAIVLKRKQN